MVRLAVGFWLFDADAFGSLDRGEDLYRWKRTLDLRGHWPELGLSRLL